MREVIETLCAGTSLAQPAIQEVFEHVLAGEVSEIELSALLVALKAKGESPAEIAGAAQAMRAAATPLEHQQALTVDSCGTGGDGSSTVNISTAVAVVVAEAGLAVVKHGNRSISSKCGSADVLQLCGINIEAGPEVALRCLSEERICFLFAPRYHAAMRHAMPVRRALRTRTIFNLLGPLTNPAQPRVQLVGVYDPALCQPLAETLGLLGCEQALVVHGSGLDEIAVHGPTKAARLHHGVVELMQLTPEQAGLKTHPLAALAGGEPEDNARWLQRLLGGQGSKAQNHAVAINAGALLWIAGAAESHREGVQQALETIAGGGARARLQRWGTLSHQGAPS
ncbi:MAG: anthranilate phosphoribosyltransferase [Deltaproteobacteria bacterium]|nr:anthranilate phosphoribosyltransferase [Deltaproteobacteria bacterium]